MTDQRVAHLDGDVQKDVQALLDRKGGILVWRVNQFQLEKVKSEDVGIFYKGDCYLILNVGKVRCSIHYWQGADSTTDERGYVAIQAVELDDILGGSAVQYREESGSEADVFFSIFSGKGNNPQYIVKNGGYQTAFRSANVKFEPHLYEVKGKVRAMVNEVSCRTSSLHANDCYILDGGKTYGVFVLHGKNCNKNEAAKAIKASENFRGRGAVPIIVGENEVNQDPQIRKALQKLLGVSLSRDIKFERVHNISDEEHEHVQTNEMQLYQVHDDTFKEVTPIKQSSLDAGDCFILKTASKVFVWKGRHASKEERRRAAMKAEEFIREKNMPKHSQVAVFAQYAEPPVFKACFKDWKDKDETDYSKVDFSRPVRKTSNVAKSVHTVIDFRTLYAKEECPPHEVDPYAEDDLSGQTTIYRIELDAKDKHSHVAAELIQCEKDGLVFNSGDSYLITYEPRSRDPAIIYYWIGNESEQRESGTAALLASKIDERKYKGSAIQERVLEGKEPAHFMKIFGGYIIIKQDHFDGKNSHLFHVRGKAGNIKIIEVAVDASNLNSTDCFILLSPSSKVYVWCGRGSIGDEREFAKVAARNLFPKHGFTLVMESVKTDAPAEFWEGLGGKKEYHHTTVAGDTESNEGPQERPPRLFHFYNIRGSLEAEEIYDFDQDDLNSDDVFVLDTFTRLYVWIGKDCRKDEKQNTIKFLPEFIKNDPTARNGSEVQISTIRQGFEPKAFKSYFGVWEDQRVKEMSIEDMKRLQIEKNSDVDGRPLIVRPDKSYDYKVLCESDDLPWDVDPLQKETYLSDEEFNNIFQMSKEEFSRKKTWQRDELKKKYNLF